MTLNLNKKISLTIIMSLLFFRLYLQVIEVTAQSNDPTPVYAVSWRPDGTRLAIGAGNNLQILGEDFQVIQSQVMRETVRSIHWSPDGQRIIVGRQILDAETLSILLTIDTETNLGQWSRDSLQVFTLAADSMGISIFDTVNGSLIKTISTGGTIIDGAVWSPDNTRFATVFSAANAVVILDVASGGIVANYPQTVSPGSLAWSPDGTRIAGSTLVEVETGTEGSVPSANGAVLFEVYVWDAHTGQVLNHFSRLPEYPHVLRWHPDGIELAGAASNGGVFVWNTTTNQQEDYFLSSGVATRIEYGPFGGRLAVGTNPAQLVYVSPERRVASSSRTSAQNVPNLGLEIVVPNPSLERLQTIAQHCNLPNNLSEMLNTPEQLPTFVTQLRAANNPQISSGCSADLLAVADALQTSP